MPLSAAAQPAAPPFHTQVEELVHEGEVAFGEGKLDSAEEFFGQALAAHESLGGADLHTARIITHLGEVARQREDLDQAQAHLDRAFSLLQAAGPESVEMATLALKEKLAPNSLTLAITLNNLGIVALYREDLAAAESYSRRSLALREALAPDSLAVATALTNVAGLVRRRGDLAAAEALHRRGMAIRERLAPDSLVVSDSSVLKMVTDLRALPAARHEVDRIVALFPGSAEAFVGARATEERVKGLASPVRYVHFATHAVLDDDSPIGGPGRVIALSLGGLPAPRGRAMRPRR